MSSTPFGSVQQINAGVLNVGYVEAGPAGGPAVMLLHGWPYDIHSFADVTPGRPPGRRRATGSSSRSSAAMGPPAFFRTTPSVTVSKRRWRWMPSH